MCFHAFPSCIIPNSRDDAGRILCPFDFISIILNDVLFSVEFF